MKKTIAIFALALCFSASVFSQKEFKKVYELKIPVSVDDWAYNGDKSLVVAGDMAEICGIDAVAGKVMWQMNFKEKFKVKKVESWEFDSDRGFVEVKYKGEKRDEFITVYLDERTGEQLGDEAVKRTPKEKHQKYSKSKRNKSSFVGRGGLVLDSPAVRLNLSYERPTMNASFGRGKKMPITVRCSGEYSWSKTIEGSFVRALCDNVIGYGDDFGGDFIDIDTYGNYVFVQYEGLTVLDMKTGAELWSTTFDFSSFDFGVFKSEMIIGRAPMPVCDENAAYIADLSKDVRAIRKFDLRTGQKLWESERLPKDAIITEMIVVNGALIVRNGGEVLVQKLVTNANDGSQTCISEMKEEGDFSLNAYDTSTGKSLWVADDLKALGDKFKGISNLLSADNLVYVSSEKNLFALEPKTGVAKWKADVTKMKIGKPSSIYFIGSDILVDGKEGLGRVSKSDGSVKYATNTDQNLGGFFRGDVFYLWTGKKPDERNKFIRFNLETGAIEGGIDDTYYPYFSDDGNEFIKKKDQSLFRFRTN